MSKDKNMGKILPINLETEQSLNKYDASDCLNPSRIYLTKFNVFPNILGLNPTQEKRRCLKGITFRFDVEEALNQLLKVGYNVEVNRVEDVNEKGEFYNKRIVAVIPEIKTLIYSREEILMDNTHNERTSDFIELYYSDKDDIKQLLRLIWNKCYNEIDTSVKTNLFAIKQTQSGFQLIPKKIKTFDIDVDSNYNDDFKKCDSTITDFFKRENDHGLVILNGTMGTGKTYYIRHLIQNNPDINFILGTRTIAENLAEPSFINFLSENSNSVLILEDCENIVKKRSENMGSAITNLLNIGDGLLSDSLNIKIIITFNTDIKNIDTALQRKGRLKYQYTFDKLSLEKTKKMFEKLNYKVPDNLTDGLTLAEIYNYYDENNVESQPQKIGF